MDSITATDKTGVTVHADSNVKWIRDNGTVVIGRVFEVTPDGWLVVSEYEGGMSILPAAVVTEVDHVDAIAYANEMLAQRAARKAALR